MMMKHLMILVGLLIPSLIFCLTIRDLQYTQDAGFDGTYPSSYLNQQVNVEGVVIATDFLNNQFVISETQGGPWSAISVISSNTSVEPGQYVEIEGRVSEFHGMTCIRLSRIQILREHHSLPHPYSVTLQELNNNECYESVLVKVNNISMTKSHKIEFPYSISNNSCVSYIGNGFNHLKENSRKSLNKNLMSITGIVSFSNNRFSLNPRDDDDFVYHTTGSQASSWGRIKSLYR
jgi:hypothetical protein